MKGLLINYECCTGCHTCEVACQQEHGYSPTEMGIEVRTIGPIQLDERKWQYEFVPTLNELCDLCAKRVEGGKLPTCVQHCQTGCIKYGEISELAAEMDKKKMVLFSQA